MCVCVVVRSGDALAQGAAPSVRGGGGGRWGRGGPAAAAAAHAPPSRYVSTRKTKVALLRDCVASSPRVEGT